MKPRKHNLTIGRAIDQEFEAARKKARRSPGLDIPCTHRLDPHSRSPWPTRTPFYGRSGRWGPTWRTRDSTELPPHRPAGWQPRRVSAPRLCPGYLVWRRWYCRSSSLAGRSRLPVGPLTDVLSRSSTVECWGRRVPKTGCCWGADVERATSFDNGCTNSRGRMGDAEPANRTLQWCVISVPMEDQKLLSRRRRGHYWYPIGNGRWVNICFGLDWTIGGDIGERESARREVPTASQQRNRLACFIFFFFFYYYSFHFDF